MIDQLPIMREPTWLSKLSASSIENGSFPLREILRGSLYYPSSGFDGDPIRYLAGNILSFIYVDYGHEKEEFERFLLAPGFLGYEVLGRREVAQRELIPRGWDPQSIPHWDRPPLEWHDAHGTPFCTWVVMQRRADFSDEHGPSRFSLLYWRNEGLTAFHALYQARRVAPKAIAVIQPGYGFGGNWADFTDPRGPFARSVLGNPGGQPKVLLFGGDFNWQDYREPCWPGYEDWLDFLQKANGGSIGVWKMS